MATLINSSQYSSILLQCDYTENTRKLQLLNRSQRFALLYFKLSNWKKKEGELYHV